MIAAWLCSPSGLSQEATTKNKTLYSICKANASISSIFDEQHKGVIFLR
ncbi:hypothetical protein PSPO_a1386 [Pseudoalteromonas spongiae UST010723-006]|nr:hypothetical protein PSPO_a1386 [Pseudoalteromonas spongiae UST010723-006]